MNTENRINFCVCIASRYLQDFKVNQQLALECTFDYPQSTSVKLILFCIYFETYFRIQLHEFKMLANLKHFHSTRWHRWILNVIFCIHYRFVLYYFTLSAFISSWYKIGYHLLCTVIFFLQRSFINIQLKCNNKNCQMNMYVQWLFKDCGVFMNFGFWNFDFDECRCFVLMRRITIVVSRIFLILNITFFYKQNRGFIMFLWIKLCHVWIENTL